MKRYHAQPISPVHGVCIVDDPHGEYVRYEDAQAEIAKLAQDRDRYAQLTERMKSALRQPGTEGSYVEWAAECRDAVDKLKDAQAEIERLRDALDQIARLYERDSCAGSMHLAQLFYDARCIARTTLSTETPDESK